ncbi:hypothetical protein MMC30_000091 [Trapelia coarctata]|nr:hypothetical protein [Trapelia coarctata]
MALFGYLFALLSFLSLALNPSSAFPFASEPLSRHPDHNASIMEALVHPHSTLRRQSSHESSVYATRFPGVTWDNDNWVLSTTTFDPGNFQSRMSSANGYLGISVAASGPFFEADVPVDGDNINGWPLFNRRQTFATMSGFFDQQPTTNGTNYPWLNQLGGESVISGVPHWGGIIVVLDNGRYLDATVNPNAISNFSSSLDIKRGLSTWRYIWTPEDSQALSFNIQYKMFTNKLFVNQGVVQLQIQPNRDCNVSIVNILDGRSAVRTAFAGSAVDGHQIYTAVRPSGLQNVTAHIYAAMEATPEVDTSTLTLISDQPYLGVNDSTIAQAAQASLKAGKTTTVTKYVGGATSDGFSDPQGLAKNASLSALAMGYDQSLIYSAAEWAIVMPSDSVDSYAYPENDTLPSDPNVIEAAIMAVVNPYYLLQNTVSADAHAVLNDAPITANSISVCGLTSDCYGGLVFWDAEIWMQPGLVLAYPWAAKQIANYRVAKYGQALANVKTAYISSKNETVFSENAAVYPWTSGRYGNCTGTGPCFDYEYHINADIVLEFVNYWVASGDMEFVERELFPIIGSISAFFSDLLVKNGSRYVLTNMTDPDEYANNVDNGGYTMPAISSTLLSYNKFRELFGMERVALYDEQAANVLVSRDPDTDITLEYTGMNGSISVKQADVVLDTFPLNYQNNYTQAQKLEDLDYYASLQSPSGPGMTFSAFSVAASTLSPSGCSAYTYQLSSTYPYTRAPWYQLSEQLLDSYTANGGTHPAFPFLTGHGGANQVTIYGYLGLRITLDGILHVNPSLPPQIPYLQYRVFYWHGWPIAASSNATHTTLHRLPTPYTTHNTTYASTPIIIQLDNPPTTPPSQPHAPQLFSLPPNSTLVLANAQTFYNSTIPGNILQCGPATSTSPFLPGQFPLSAIDGALSTKWTPELANTTASVIVDLGGKGFERVGRMEFHWGNNPPASAAVVFYNATADAGTSVSVPTVEASSPFVASEAGRIGVPVGNRTIVTLGAGIQAMGAQGVTVAGGPGGGAVWTGRWAALRIQGNLGDAAANATGGSVAEWVVVGLSL